MLTDPIADLITRIRNAGLKNKSKIVVPYSKMKESLVALLKNEGYVDSFLVSSEENSVKKNITINLKYINEKPVIRQIKRVSRPGQRIYSKSKSIPRILGGMGIAIVSTSQGLMTGYQAKAKKIGGEVICKLF